MSRASPRRLRVLPGAHALPVGRAMMIPIFVPLAPALGHDAIAGVAIAFPGARQALLPACLMKRQ
jgi:hypothetical protein